MIQSKPTVLLFLLFCAFTLHADVHLSNSNMGQVVVFPLYTVANGHNTLISISNTSDQPKAVKLRFREGQNAHNVLIFNLYLNRLDTWSAAIALDGTVTNLISSTTDRSCAPFLATSQPFLPFEVQQIDGLSTPLPSIQQRMQTGIVEIYDMGQVDDTTPLADRNGFICDALEQAWLPGGIWDTDPSDRLSMPDGALKADLVVVDVASGYSFSVQPTLFNGFYPSGAQPHTLPGDVAPNLSSADTTSLVLHKGQAIRTQWPTGHEAVSASIMSSRIATDYIINSGIDAFPEFVYSLPTKRFYTQDTPTAPFNFAFDDSAQSYCMLIDRNPEYYDREGRFGVSLAPPPPPQPRLCRATNFATLIAEVNGNFQDSILSPAQADQFNVGSVTSGTFRIPLDGFVTERGSDANSQAQQRYYGLPVIGFTFQRYRNANAQPGLLATYSTRIDHQTWQNIETIP